MEVKSLEELSVQVFWRRYVADYYNSYTNDDRPRGQDVIASILLDIVYHYPRKTPFGKLPDLEAVFAEKKLPGDTVSEIFFEGKLTQNRRGQLEDVLSNDLELGNIILRPGEELDEESFRIEDYTLRVYNMDEGRFILEVDEFERCNAISASAEEVLALRKLFDERGCEGFSINDDYIHERARG